MHLVLVVIACASSTADIDDDDDDDVTTDDTGEVADDTGQVQDPSPVIERGTMMCEPGTSSPDSLIVDVEADDPQGADTIEPLGGWVEAATGGTTVFDNLMLVCNDDGDCTASFTSGNTDYGGITCKAAPKYTFTATVVDVDGHESEPFELDWQG